MDALLGHIAINGLNVSHSAFWFHSLLKNIESSYCGQSPMRCQPFSQVAGGYARLLWIDIAESYYVRSNTFIRAV